MARFRAVTAKKKACEGRRLLWCALVSAQKANCNAPPGWTIHGVIKGRALVAFNQIIMHLSQLHGHRYLQAEANSKKLGFAPERQPHDGAGLPMIASRYHVLRGQGCD